MATRGYKGKSLAWLKRECQRQFNEYVRLRDRGQPCISCNTNTTSHASHFFSVGMYDHLRFDEDNCHASCVKCNMFLHGNLFFYGQNLPLRIGQERFDELLKRAEDRGYHKWNRWELIEKIGYYKAKNKELKGS